MSYNISFATHYRDGETSFSWFVFNEAGKTLRGGFRDKKDALAWALLELGFNE